MKSVNGFTFFKNYYDAINDPDNGLSAAEQGQLYNAIFAYMFEDALPSFKGVLKMAFNLMKPSLDLSKTRSDCGAKKANESKPEANESKTEANESKPEAKKSKVVSSPSRIKNKEQEEEKEERIENKKNEQEEERGMGEEETRSEEEVEVRSVNGAERAEAQRLFFETYPTVQVDNYSAGDYAEIDFGLLSRCFEESEFLRGTKSFLWICRNYRKIVGGGYRDFPRPRSPSGQADEDVEATETIEERRRKWNELYGTNAGV